MKFATVATIVVTTVGLASAQPHHGHSHRHFHKRAPAEDQSVAYVYELNGKIIPASEVQKGVKNGTLTIPSGEKVVVQEASAAASAVPTSADVKAVAIPTSSTSTSSSVPPPAPTPSTHKHKHKHKHQAPVPTASPSTGGSGLDADFPDGQLDCSTFPSDYGAVALDYLELGGWSGIQSGSLIGGAIDSITTVTKSMCSGSDCCKPGSFCSYACPAGYQKSQWPAIQGATGQSVGGLQCQNGKLHLTNPSLSKKLCIKGVEQVQVMVKNTMGQVASVCRTDYPGTESETIPVAANPGSSQPLACPDADTYYKWQSGSTSAQYYLNPAGLLPSVACQWGNPGDDFGNYAPLNLGVGWKNGAAWLSIFQNAPTTTKSLAYDVELVGDNGGFDNFIGKCKYSKGQYCSGDDYTDCNSQGCTVNVASGTATYVLS